MESVTIMSSLLDENIPRATQDQIREQHDVIARHNELLAVLQNIPQIAFVINSARQFIYGNRALLEQLGMTGIEAALGARPGEFLHCTQTLTGGSCGENDGCRYCGAVHAILESQATQQRVTREARVTVNPAGKLIPLDLSVTVTPLSLDHHLFSLVFITDISAEKRRDYLEQIFFHDLLNSISGLKMMTDMLNLKEIPGDIREEVEDINSHVKLIVEDVSGHQMLLRAEQGSLELEVSSATANHLIMESLHSVGALISLNDINIQYEEPSPSLAVATDTRLARRVLVNALKNAIEASAPGETIKIQVDNIPEGRGCMISVHNQRPIPEDAQHQIFQRSFSTKGAERGLGTYSMRLLLEGYLGGSITFTTSPETGTTFLITLPDR